MTLKLIRLELARTKEFPDGDARHGYELRAPLTKDGRLDAAAYETSAQLCTARHFRPDGDDEHGELVRTAAGEWALSYDLGETDDEPIYRLKDHRFVAGEYVTITGHDGEARVYRVVSVSPLPLAPR
jgi:hypothetical protein